MNDSLDQALAFITEVEQLKAVQRKTRPVGLARYENSAEHSWHVCLSALVLQDYADVEIDINRVIKMLLLHDLGEIHGGDVIIYRSETPEQKQAERCGVQALLSKLSQSQAQEYLALWDEFEAGETADSQYARAIDRLPPLLQNLHDDGHSWRLHSISLEKVLQVNQRIGLASPSLWQRLQHKLQEFFQKSM